MTSKQESDLRKRLSLDSKENIIDLFIKLKKINESYCDRIDKVRTHTRDFSRELVSVMQNS